MPATNATSERTQNRLGHLRTIIVPEEIIDNLDVLDVATAFVAGSEHRLNTLVSSRFRILQKNKSTQILTHIGNILMDSQCMPVKVHLIQLLSLTISVTKPSGHSLSPVLYLNKEFCTASIL